MRGWLSLGGGIMGDLSLSLYVFSLFPIESVPSGAVVSKERGWVCNPPGLLGPWQERLVREVMEAGTCET